MQVHTLLVFIYQVVTVVIGAPDFSSTLQHYAEKGSNLSEFVHGRQCGRDSSQITVQDAERQGWRFSNRSLPITPLAAVMVDERIDLWEIKVEYDKFNMFLVYVNFAQGKILAVNSKRSNKDLYNWSVIIMVAYKALAPQFGASLKDLSLVIRCNVDNIHTSDMLEDLLDDHPDIIPKASVKTPLQQNSLPFYSMIGSPNGIGIAYMLFEHRADIGFKVFGDISVSVGVFTKYIWFEIRDAPSQAGSLPTSSA